MIADAVTAGLRRITVEDEEYPPQLRELYRPPEVLWACGVRTIGEALGAPIVAVVGTRRATHYGLRATREIVSALARAGATIVSGMARGIDAAAHQATLDVGGITVAVLGTGADVPYPRGHVALHRTIAEQGLILSEFPPGAKAGPGSFPRRNRIIAGLASLTIVVEAPAKSGALITAKDALDLSRDVAALPGPIDSPQSQGCNELIRDGAHPITSVRDALLLAKLDVSYGTAARPVITDAAEVRVWEALARGGASIDELCARTSLPVAECMSAVTGLEVRGIVECAMTGEVRRR